MSVQITVFCDFCNQEQKRRDDGRGYLDGVTIAYAAESFDWKRTKKGIKCVACQEEDDALIEKLRKGEKP